MFLDKLTFLKVCIWSGHTCSQTFNMHCFKCNGDETAYRSEVENLSSCRSDNNLTLNIQKKFFFFYPLCYTCSGFIVVFVFVLFVVHSSSAGAPSNFVVLPRTMTIKDYSILKKKTCPLKKILKSVRFLQPQ